MSLSGSMKRKFLLFSSFFILPLDFYIVACCYVLRFLAAIRHLGQRGPSRQQTAINPSVVVVTGIDSAKGLHIARAFHTAGHVVIGASFRTAGFGGCGRYSSSIQRHYTLSRSHKTVTQYAQALEKIVHYEDADLWVDCSDVTSSFENMQVAEVLRRKTRCIPFAVEFMAAEMLNDTSRFMQHLRSIGLQTLETYDVSSRSSIHKVLGGADKRGKKYVIKATQNTSQSQPNRIVLPRRTLSQTYAHVSQISVSNSNPWLLQEYVEGSAFCAQALLVNDKILMFTAWEPCGPSIAALPAASPIRGALLKFVEIFLQRTRGNWTGHLGFDFRVQERSTEKGLEQLLYPIRARTSLQDGILVYNKQTHRLAEFYLRAVIRRDLKADDRDGLKVLSESREVARHWVVEDLLRFAIGPLCRSLKGRQGVAKILADTRQLFKRVCFWNDPFFDFWDPLPWWYKHHVDLPIALLELGGQKRDTNHTNDLRGDNLVRFR